MDKVNTELQVYSVLGNQTALFWYVFSMISYQFYTISLHTEQCIIKKYLKNNNTSLNLLWKFRSPCLRKATAAARTVLPTLTSACSISMCPNSVAAGVWNFKMCAQISMHVTAHSGCANTVRESALKVNSGRKILCHPGELNPCQYCIRLFGLMSLYQLSCPAPIVLVSTHGRQQE